MQLLASSYYDMAFKAELDAIWPNLSADLGVIGSLPVPAAEQALAAILRRGCQGNHVRNITLGRAAAAEIPPDWLRERIEAAADHSLNLDDDQEYRRLAELLETLDAQLVLRLVQRGNASSNPEVREAAKDVAEWHPVRRA